MVRIQKAAIKQTVPSISFWTHPGQRRERFQPRDRCSAAERVTSAPDQWNWRRRPSTRARELPHNPPPHYIPLSVPACDKPGIIVLLIIEAFGRADNASREAPV